MSHSHPLTHPWAYIPVSECWCSCLPFSLVNKSTCLPNQKEPESSGTLQSQSIIKSWEWYLLTAFGFPLFRVLAEITLSSCECATLFTPLSSVNRLAFWTVCTTDRASLLLLCVWLSCPIPLPSATCSQKSSISWSSWLFFLLGLFCLGLITQALPEPFQTSPSRCPLARVSLLFPDISPPRTPCFSFPRCRQRCCLCKAWPPPTFSTLYFQSLPSAHCWPSTNISRKRES